MNKILIDPNHCTRKEHEGLKILLNENSWNWHEIIDENKNEPGRPLDLSREVCHICGHPLVKDIENRTERCVHYSCQARNIDFTIPFVEVFNYIEGIEEVKV